MEERIAGQGKRQKRQGLWQAALNRANAALPGGLLFATHQSVIHPVSNFWLLSNIHINWRKGGRVFIAHVKFGPVQGNLSGITPAHPYTRL